VHITPVYSTSFNLFVDCSLNTRFESSSAGCEQTVLEDDDSRNKRIRSTSREYINFTFAIVDCNVLYCVKCVVLYVSCVVLCCAVLCCVLMYCVALLKLYCDDEDF
jgi:hypothetical protein